VRRACAGRPHPHAGNATARISASASATYFGTPQLVADGCGNDLTCGPASCTRVADPACSLGSKTNITEAAMQRLVSAVTSRTCTPSADARCSSAALAAVFGRFPAVKAAYCNDAFLVLHSTDLPSHPSTLGAIQSPPGGDETPRCVTRGYVTAQYAFKVPLAPQALPTSDGLLNNAGAFPSEALDNLATLNSATNMPTSGPAAVSVSGIPWFPSFNNRGLLTWGSCEVDVCNAHAGKGFDCACAARPPPASPRLCARAWAADCAPARAQTTTTATPSGRNACTQPPTTARWTRTRPWWATARTASPSSGAT
jgi:hypothetical protein